MAKRITTSVARWSFISENMLEIDQPRISALKTFSDSCLRQVSEKPAELPKIDWSYYKSRISAPGMVESFQKTYDALKIPYPSDQGALAATEASNNRMIKHAEGKLNEIATYVEKLQKTLKEKEAVMKHSDMTVEEYILLKPDARSHNPDNVRFWPHEMYGEVKEDKKHDH